MEPSSRGKKKGNKRNNVDKLSESGGPLKSMKDKLKDKSLSLPGGDLVKQEPSIDSDFKKEAGCNTICDNDMKKNSEGKNLTPGNMKVQDRPFLDAKSEASRPEDNSEEDELQNNLMSSKIKTENVTGDGNMFPPDGNENLMMGLVNQSGPPNQNPGIESGPPAGVQPLPSNVINKQPGTMEAQYMQQQSQIFVFSTALANKAAESVLQGQFPSIIAYHCAQPGTKKYLEKHPLKLNQFNRQSPAQWLNNLAQIKQKSFANSGPPVMKNMPQVPMGPRPMVMPLCEMGGPNPRPMAPVPIPELEGINENELNREMMDSRQDYQSGNMNQMNMWNQGGNMSQNNIPPCSGSIKNEKPCLGQRPSIMENLPNTFPGASQLTLTGTKVPTENLTPQQRQHREEQLATLRKMQQMLFPENQSQPTEEFGNEGNRNGVEDKMKRRGLNGGGMENPMGMNPGLPQGMEGEPLEPMQDQSPIMMQKMVGGNSFPSVTAQLEWQKLQHQFYEERKKKGSRTESPAPRCKMQGPPPPYHQTTRSASVPIAIPSPNPGSPSNTTSNLSLPSPRTTDLNSPSDLQKGHKLATCSPPALSGSPSCSKLDTSLSASQSPNRKDSSLEYSNKDLFSRGLNQPQSQSSTQPPQPSPSTPKHHKPPLSKEPNLMPVPSPQQIQYLNTFEGQELTIQKQPNTSLKETNINSPLSHASLSEIPKSKTPNGASNSPLPQPQDNSPRFPNPMSTMPMSTMSMSMSMSMNSPTVNTSSTSTPNPGAPMPQSAMPPNKDSTTVPSSPDTSGPSPCRSDNIPLNPNGMNLPPNPKSLHFDPITSLAQMSQQLTSQNAPPCPQNPPMMPFNQNSYPGMDLDHSGMDFGPMMDMQGPPGPQVPPQVPPGPPFMGSNSPKPNQQPRCVGPFYPAPNFPRMMAPNTYNGMNVQVKASTPNTIQYLPTRPNTNSPNPNNRAPPSLDFLQRFTNPINSMDQKMYMPEPPQPQNCPNPNMLLGNSMLRGQIRPIMKINPVFSPNCEMMGNPFIQNSKSSPLGLPPDASQPLPPSMSQGNNFKNSPFVGPTVADPNYAQQFHNFQQQLYATNTRSQLNSHLSQSYFLPK